MKKLVLGVSITTALLGSLLIYNKTEVFAAMPMEKYSISSQEQSCTTTNNYAFYDNQNTFIKNYFEAPSNELWRFPQPENGTPTQTTTIRIYNPYGSLSSTNGLASPGALIPDFSYKSNYKPLNYTKVLVGEQNSPTYFKSTNVARTALKGQVVHEIRRRKGSLGNQAGLSYIASVVNPNGSFQTVTETLNIVFDQGPRTNGGQKVCDNIYIAKCGDGVKDDGTANNKINGAIVGANAAGGGTSTYTPEECDGADTPAGYTCNTQCKRTPVVPVPTCTNLSLTPSSLVGNGNIQVKCDGTNGASTNVIYSATGVNGVYLTQNGNLLDKTVSLTMLNQTQPITYKFVCFVTNGTKTSLENPACTKTLTITPPAQPEPTCSLSLNTATATPGQSITLNWSSANGFISSIVGLPVFSPFPLTNLPQQYSGSKTFTAPSTPGNYSFIGTVTAGGKTINCPVALQVVQNPPVCTSLDVDPASGIAPLDSSFACNGVNAESAIVTINGPTNQTFTGLGNGLTNVFILPLPGTYTVSCKLKNSAGQTDGLGNCQKTIVVGTPAIPQCTLSLNDLGKPYQPNQSATLTRTELNGEVFQINALPNQFSPFPANVGPNPNSLNFNVPSTAGQYSFRAKIRGANSIERDCMVNYSVVAKPIISDVWLQKDVDKPVVKQGDQVSYTIKYGNYGPDTATGVTIIDTLPAGFTFSSFTSNPTITLVSNQNGIIKRNVPNLAKDQQGTITVVGTISSIPSTQTFINTGTIDTVTPEVTKANNTDTATSTVQQRYDLYIRKVIDQGTYGNGETAIFTITYGNSGQVAAVFADVIDSLPAGLQFVSASIPHTLTDAGEYRFQIGTVNPGQTGTFTITAKVTGLQCSKVTNIATIAAQDSNILDINLYNNIDMATALCGQPDVYIIKERDKATLVPSDIINYTLNYGNSGAISAENVEVVDKLPLGITNRTRSFEPGNGPTPTVSVGSNNSSELRFRIGTLAPGQSGKIRIQGTVQTPLQATLFVNTGIISTTTPQCPGCTNNDISVVNSNAGSTDVEIIKAASVSQAIVNGEITYTLTYRNNGQVTAENVKIRDTLPSNVTYKQNSMNPSAAHPSLFSSDGFLIGTLTPGQAGQISFTVVVNAQGNGLVTNTGYISTTTTETNYNNNVDDVTTTISNPQTDISVTKDVNPSQVSSNQEFTYTIVYRNASNTLAENVRIKDILPTNTQILEVSSTDLPGININNINDFLIGTLQPNQQGTIRMRARFTVSTPNAEATNVVKVETTTPETNYNNNQDDATATLVGFCGDGLVNNDEECDGSSPDNTKSCSADCQLMILPVCGNNKVEFGEQCDDGNRNNGDGCSDICTPEGKPYQPPRCSYVDVSSDFTNSLSVQMGELVPFYRNIEDPNYGPCKVPADADNVELNTVECTFDIYNGSGLLEIDGPGQASLIMPGCRMNISDDPILNTSTINENAGKIKLFKKMFKGFNSNQNIEKDGRHFFEMDRNRFGSDFGEYKITLSNIKFNVCTLSADKKSVTRAPQNFSKRVCEANFAVTEPYLMQRGATNKSTTGLTNFNLIDGAEIIQSNEIGKVSPNKYNGGPDLQRITTDFVSKYEKLATAPVQESELNGKLTYANIDYIKKVPGQNIYVAKGVSNTDTFTITEALSDKPYTLIVLQGQLAVVDSLKGNGMFVVPNGKIIFDTNNCNVRQEVEGLFITNIAFGSENNYGNSDSIFNGNADKYRCNDGRLKIKGSLVGDGVEQLVYQRRSSLPKRFIDRPSDRDDIIAKYRNDIIEGASLLIESNPSFWRNLPPGASDLVDRISIVRE